MSPRVIKYDSFLVATAVAVAAADPPAMGDCLVSVMCHLLLLPTFLTQEGI